ncbi:hypothetical protein LXL04_012595 [Taraxacum kok-saghyz]
MYDEKVCPLDVIQDSSVDTSGGQFMFVLIGTFEDKYLHTDSILGIESRDIKGECTKSTFWTIPDVEEPAPSNLITIGGGFEDYSTCFQIVEFPKPTSPEVPSYMLQHCPSFCGAGPQTCFNISIYLDNGVRRLGFTGGDPFEFAFYKESVYWIVFQLMRLSANKRSYGCTSPPSLSYVLLLLFIIATPSSISSTDDHIVKDSKGKKVLNNVRYHIGPVIPANGGRIKLANTMFNKKVCPFNVVQDPSKDTLGGQFMFTLIGKFEDKYL